MSTPYGLIIELSRNEKLQKYRIILSQHANYLHKWLLLLNLTCLLLPCCFFSVRFLNMCKPRTTFHLLWWTWPSGLTFYGGGAAYLLSWIGMANAGWLGSMRSEIFFQMKFTIFQGCSTKEDAFLSGQPTPCNQLLTPYFCLFRNTILHKMLKLGFWNFKPFFLRMQISLVAAFFFFFSSFSHLFEWIFAC